MGSYVTIEITGPLVDLEKVKLKKLPVWEYYEYSDWDLNEIVEHSYGHPPVQTGRWHIDFSGASKWSDDEPKVWARRFTAKRPTLTVVYRDEWDNRDADEPGSEEWVYRGGEVVAAESKVSGELPANLDELLANATAALDSFRALVEVDPDAMIGYMPVDAIAHSLSDLVRAFR